MSSHPDKFDFHTHDLTAPAGRAVINLPADWTLHPSHFAARAGCLYSAGVHPWWTADEGAAAEMLRRLPALLRHPQVVAVGECGLDMLRGAPPDVQEEVLHAQVLMAEEAGLPVTLHIVKAYDRLLRLRKVWRPTTRWTVHGFRGKAPLAVQLLRAGIDLSFGRYYDDAAYALTPPARRHRESDSEGICPSRPFCQED